MSALKVKILAEGAHPPEKAHPGDLGYDLFAAEHAVIPSGELRLVKTGIALEFPDGWGGVIRDRSSMALKRVTVSAGVIDHGYRGEVAVALTNHSPAEFVIEPGQKIAQLIPTPVTDWTVTVSGDLNHTARGAGGFGSTGAGKKHL